jgi:hypothetical protein
MSDLVGQLSIPVGVCQSRKEILWTPRTQGRGCAPSHGVSLTRYWADARGSRAWLAPSRPMRGSLLRSAPTPALPPLAAQLTASLGSLGQTEWPFSFVTDKNSIFEVRLKLIIIFSLNRSKPWVSNLLYHQQKLLSYKVNFSQNNSKPPWVSSQDLEFSLSLTPRLSSAKLNFWISLKIA